MNEVVAGVIIVLAVPTACYLFAWAWFAIGDLDDAVKHRLLVRQAKREGWRRPAMPAAWRLMDNGAPMRGVTGIGYDVEFGIDITEWRKRARKIEREVEEAWLCGIQDEKRKAREREDASLD